MGRNRQLHPPQGANYTPPPGGTPSPQDSEDTCRRGLYQIHWQSINTHGVNTGLGMPNLSRAAKRGGFKRGGFPICTRPSFFVLFCPCWDFPDFSGIFLICSGMVRGFSRFVLFLFLGLLRAPTRNSPERVRGTIWTFPKRVGNPRVWNPPGLASLKFASTQTLQENTDWGLSSWPVGQV